MTIGDYLRIARMRWRIIAACCTVSLAMAAGYTMAASPVYEARAQIFVSTAELATVDGALTGNQLSRLRVLTYRQLAESATLRDAIAQKLPATGVLAELEQVTATVPTDTTLLELAVRARSATGAATLTNIAADELVRMVSDLERPAEQAASPIRLSVIRRATPPSSPVLPRPPLNIGIGLFLGLGVGFLAALLRENLDTRIKGAEVLRQITGVPNLGVLPYDAAAAITPLISSTDTKSRRGEAFRQFRTNLQFIDVDRPVRSIVVTSAVPGEGKSTTVVNLSIALAEAGVAVVLVDADLRKPRLADYLGLEGAVGLTDVLIGRARLEDVLQQWGASPLLVLPSGPIPPNPSELLGSQHMHDVLRQLEGRGLVLLDAPPLLPVTDAAVLGAAADGTILLVQAHSTTHDHVARAADLIGSVDAHLVGTVLNMVPAKAADTYQYYGYGERSRAIADAGAAGAAEQDASAFSQRDARPA